MWRILKRPRRRAEVKGLWSSELQNAILVWSLSTYFISLLRGNKRCVLKKGDHTPKLGSFYPPSLLRQRGFSVALITPRVITKEEKEIPLLLQTEVWLPAWPHYQRGRSCLISDEVISGRHEIFTLGLVSQAWLVYFWAFSRSFICISHWRKTLTFDHVHKHFVNYKSAENQDCTLFYFQH